MGTRRDPPSWPRTLWWSWRRRPLAYNGQYHVRLLHLRNTDAQDSHRTDSTNDFALNKPELHIQVEEVETALETENLETSEDTVIRRPGHLTFMQSATIHTSRQDLEQGSV